MLFHDASPSGLFQAIQISHGTGEKFRKIIRINFQLKDPSIGGGI
jgi:hypothetical protein